MPKARPRQPQPFSRSIHLGIRVSEKEHGRLVAAAAARGMSNVSTLVRSMIGPVITKPEPRTRRRKARR